MDERVVFEMQLQEIQNSVDTINQSVLNINGNDQMREIDDDEWDKRRIEHYHKIDDGIKQYEERETKQEKKQEERVEQINVEEQSTFEKIDEHLKA